MPRSDCPRSARSWSPGRKSAYEAVHPETEHSGVRKGSLILRYARAIGTILGQEFQCRHSLAVARRGRSCFAPCYRTACEGMTPIERPGILPHRANARRQCLLPGEDRKTYARTEFFSV
jgi:hypothetical protein